jgi:flagellar M-ring protein FliF
MRRESTRNYELDKTIEHNREPPGRIRRLSVAVLVDHVPQPGAEGKTVSAALSAGQLDEIRSLVREAVGFDEARGDKLSVVNAPFVKEVIEDGDAFSSPFWETPALQAWARQIFGLLVVVILLLAVVRPMIRQFMAQPNWHDLRDVTPRDDELGADSLSLSGAAGAAAAGTAARNAAPQPAPMGAFDQKLMLAREAVEQDPRRVAQVVKKWVSDDA